MSRKRVAVFGHRGLVGSAIARQLRDLADDIEIVTTDIDLRDRAAVDAFFAEQRPTHVVLAAARVGGIVANAERPVEFLVQNLDIQRNVLYAAATTAGVERTVFLGSSCIYPRDCPQPMRECHLMTGPLEETNRAYAMAKLCGLELCRALSAQFGSDVVALMPPNLYGPGDNFDGHASHVIPALIRKFVEAKARNAPEVVVWGSGKPRREFLYADDVAEAVVHVVNAPGRFESVVYNVGSGTEISIRDLARMIASLVGHDPDASITWDDAKPDGTPCKLMDSSAFRAACPSWTPQTSLEDGLKRTIDWFVQSRDTVRDFASSRYN